jgi:hypothetical protein
MKKKLEQQAEEFERKMAEAQKQGNKIVEQLNNVQAKAARDNAENIARQQAMMDQFAQERKHWKDLLTAKDQQTQSQPSSSTSGISLLNASELLKVEFPMTNQLRNQLFQSIKVIHSTGPRLGRRGKQPTTNTEGISTFASGISSSWAKL